MLNQLPPGSLVREEEAPGATLSGLSFPTASPSSWEPGAISFPSDPRKAFATSALIPPKPCSEDPFSAILSRGPSLPQDPQSPT